MTDLRRSDEPDRVLRSHDEARRSYDRLSGWYDLLSGGSERYLDETALLLLDPKAGEAVLDIGFGTGRALEWIRGRTTNTGRVTGVDISEGMRRVASRRLVRRGFDDVELVIANAFSLPFTDDSFDAIFIGFTLELFDTPELPVVLTEVKRVLRGVGRVAIAALSLRRTESRPVRIYRWMHRRFPGTVDCRPIPVKRLAEEAGFVVDELREELMWGLPVDLIRASKAARRTVGR